jgi:hypothetical protein
MLDYNRDRWWNEAEEEKKEEEKEEEYDPVVDALAAAEQEADRQSFRGASEDYQYQPSIELPRESKKPGKSKEKSKPKPKLPSIRRARDGQTFDQQSSWTKSAFRHQHGPDAEEEWIRQHEADLDRNQRLYGSQEPVPGQKPVASAPIGTKAASDRRIGAVSPPEPSVSPEPTAPAASTAAPAASTAAPATGNVLGLGAIGNQAAPSSSAPTPAAQNPDDVLTVLDTITGKRVTMTRSQYDEQLRHYPAARSTTRIESEQPATPAETTGASTSLPGRAGAATPAAPAMVAPLESPDDDILIENVLGVQRSVKRRTLPGWIEAGHKVVGEALPAGQAKPEAAPGGQAKPETQRLSMLTADDPIVRALESGKPIDSIVQLSGRPPEQARTITAGIGALLRGDPKGAWAEPYLNDVARLAWAREERSQGRNVDPRDAPPDYLESWKDGFFGSDHRIPLVRELDQQMIDYAVDRFGGPGKPFNWKTAFGETGENGLISTQIASNDCGPNAASVILRSQGYNADPAAMFAYAKQRGYHDGNQFTGPNNMARMLREEAGIQAVAAPVDWAVIDSELDAGRPVLLSSGGHYWAVSARRSGPSGTEYYAGATASTVSNPEWARPGAIRYGGAPNVMVTSSGQVDPNSRVVQALGLKPPTGSGLTPDRQLLSLSTSQKMAERVRASEAQRRTPNTGETVLMQAVPVETVITGTVPEAYVPIITRVAAEEEVDPLLVAAVMHSESSGDPNAVSPVGAGGLMQLMPATARSLGVTDVRDPEQNIRGGSKYLAQLIRKYDGNLEHALAAYNAGPGAVDRYGGIPPFKETQLYVPKVLNRYRQLKKSSEGTGQE